MKAIIQIISKVVILLCITFGGYLIYKNKDLILSQVKPEAVITETNPKAIILKKYLLQYKKPNRVEIVNLTQKFDADVAEIKKMKIPLDKQSDFYVNVKFFTDETDDKAPLVAQINFLD